jgi:uncharacterized protein (DUF433 family)
MTLQAVTKNPKIMHGEPCFAGTRVPVRSLFDHLEAGYNVEYFVSEFPTVTREQAMAVLRGARDLVEESALIVEPAAVR